MGNDNLNNERNCYVFQVSNQTYRGNSRKAVESFNFLVRDRCIWGIGRYTPNRKKIKKGDGVLFYITGPNNRYFIGNAIANSSCREDLSDKSKSLFFKPEILRINLRDVLVFSHPRFLKEFPSIQWRPSIGGLTKISEKDFDQIVSSYT